MDDLQRQAEHLENLRQWRNRKPRDLTLGYLKKYVARKYTRPLSQMGPFAELWQEALPPRLHRRTALVALHNGVLTIHVADSPTLYQIDRLMRSGLERQLKSQSKAAITCIKLKLGAVKTDDSDRIF
ncbi:MAG: DciA family protein [Planctomycetota bacterium]|jgi:hypothetical protein